MAFGKGHRTNVRHGMSHSLTHRAWTAMIERCSVRSSVAFKDYGAKGISVCERWKVFENFYADMGPRPSQGHSLDRIAGGVSNYEPGNVRWATHLEQAHNKASNVINERIAAEIRWLADERYKHREIAERLGLNRELVSKVIRNERWPDPAYVYAPRRRSPLRQHA